MSGFRDPTPLAPWARKLPSSIRLLVYEHGPFAEHGVKSIRWPSRKSCHLHIYSASAASVASLSVPPYTACVFWNRAGIWLGRDVPGFILGVLTYISGPYPEQFAITLADGVTLSLLQEFKLESFDYAIYSNAYEEQVQRMLQTEREPSFDTVGTRGEYDAGVWMSPRAYRPRLQYQFHSAEGSSAGGRRLFPDADIEVQRYTRGGKIAGIVTGSLSTSSAPDSASQ